MNIDFLSSGEKKHVIEKLEEQHGIDKIPHLLLRVGREKIRGYSGVLSKDEIKKLNSTLRIENIGVYLIKDEHDETRLSIEGCHALSPINKNIIEIDDIQKEKWMKGENIDVNENENGIKVILYKGLFLGSGKASKGKMINFVPKERRVKN